MHVESLHMHAFCYIQASLVSDQASTLCASPPLSGQLHSELAETAFLQLPQLCAASACQLQLSGHPSLLLSGPAGAPGSAAQMPADLITIVS